MRHLFRERPHFQRPQLPFRHRSEVGANLSVRGVRYRRIGVFEEGAGQGSPAAGSPRRVPASHGVPVSSSVE